MNPDPLPQQLVHPQPTQQPLAQTPVPQSAKPKGTLVVILIAIVVLALGTAGFFAYQNYQLTRQVAYPQTIPTPTSILTPTPTSMAGDPTANWQIFNNSNWKLTLKYPPTFSMFTTSGGEYHSTDSKTGINLRLSKGTITNSDIYSSAFQTAVGQQIVSKENTKIANLTTDGRTTSLISMDYLKDTQDVPSYSYVYIIKDGGSLYILNFWQDQTQGQNIKSNILNNQSLFNQILSTFKFVEGSPTALVPADSQTPAAGTCPSFVSKTISITLNIDTPFPRCVKIFANQSLLVVNGTDQSVSMEIASVKTIIAPNQSYQIADSVISELAPGVHFTKTSLYGGNGPELWVQ